MTNKKYNTEEHNLFLFSDPHFMHRNLCKGTSVWPDKEKSTRDFNTIEEMNQTIVDNINNKVGENDILYCLGDWSFSHPSNVRYFRGKLKVKTIHLILGNHDKVIRKNKDNVQSIFSSVQDYTEIQIDKQKIILCHYPIARWRGMNRSTFMLHGHCHSKYQGEGKILDVGIDSYYKLFGNYDSFSYEEIKEILNNKQ